MLMGGCPGRRGLVPEVDGDGDGRVEDAGGTELLTGLDGAAETEGILRMEEEVPFVLVRGSISSVVGRLPRPDGTGLSANTSVGRGMTIEPPLIDGLTGVSPL